VFGQASIAFARCSFSVSYNRQQQSIASRHSPPASAAWRVPVTVDEINAQAQYRKRRLAAGMAVDDIDHRKVIQC